MTELCRLHLTAAVEITKKQQQTKLTKTHQDKNTKQTNKIKKTKTQTTKNTKHTKSTHTKTYTHPKNTHKNNFDKVIPFFWPHIEAYLLVNSRAYVVKVDSQCGRDWAHFDILRDVAFVLFLLARGKNFLPLQEDG